MSSESDFAGELMNLVSVWPDLRSWLGIDYQGSA